MHGSKGTWKRSWDDIVMNTKRVQKHQNERNQLCVNQNTKIKVKNYSLCKQTYLLCLLSTKMTFVSHENVFLNS